MQQSQVRERSRRPARKPDDVVAVRFLDDILHRAYRALDSGDPAGFVAGHREAGVTPPRQLVIAWARKALWRGELEAALQALSLVGARADREDLFACARAAAEQGNAAVEKRALSLASHKR